MAKESFRLVHASDIHLDTPNSRQVLERLRNFCQTGDVDLVIFAGDLFDSNRETEDTLGFAIQTLRTFNVPLLLLPGNHDCLVHDSVYHRAEFLSLHQHIKVFKQCEGETFSLPDLDVSVWGKPLCDYGSDMHPMAGIPPRGQERWQLAVAHGQLMDKMPDSGRSFPITTREIAVCDRDYVALGHRPTPGSVGQGAVAAYYSGAATEMNVFLAVDFAVGRNIRVTTHQL